MPFIVSFVRPRRWRDFFPMVVLPAISYFHRKRGDQKTTGEKKNILSASSLTTSTQIQLSLSIYKKFLRAHSHITQRKKYLKYIPPIVLLIDKKFLGLIHTFVKVNIGQSKNLENCKRYVYIGSNFFHICRWVLKYVVINTALNTRLHMVNKF